MIRPHTSLDIKEAFAPAGFISRSLTGFEVRPQQVEMARAIQRALLGSRHLAVEAGTGVGKSFAYLIPTIGLVCRTGSKALISTYTITLQEQLYVDGAEVAIDAAPLSGLRSAEGGPHFGASSTLAAGTFFSGLIDDIRIYNRVVSP